MLQKDGLRLTVCACYSWEMSLNVSLDASFDNVQDCKGIQENAGQVNDMKVYVTNDETSH